jgi:TPP-dependent indolepyruvate ferredoxin oxidoreductase alpha subunit
MSKSYHTHQSKLQVNNRRCELCNKCLDTVGGSLSIIICPSATIARMPLCYSCEAQLDCCDPNTVRAFARAMLPLRFPLLAQSEVAA